MKIARFLRSVAGRALRNLVDYPRLHLPALTVMTLMLSVLGAFMVIAANLARVRDHVGGDRLVTAFIGAGVDAAGQRQLQAQARAIPGVSDVELLSAEQAAKRFREALGPHGAVLDDLGDDIVPASLMVTAAPGTTAAGVEELARALQGLVGVEEVVYALDELQRLSVLIRIVELAALAVGALILFVTIIVVSNTIRLTVVARQQEIGIMKLVGATDAYVRLPFVLEGALEGLLAGGLAVVTVWTVHQAFSQRLSDVAGELHLIGLAPNQALTIVGAGGVLGLLAGVISVGRFLKDP